MIIKLYDNEKIKNEEKKTKRNHTIILSKCKSYNYLNNPANRSVHSLSVSKPLI